MWAAKGQIVQVREIMHRNVQKINTDIILAEAAKKMRDLEIGCLLVLDQEKLVGILTDRDIVCRAIAEYRCHVERCRSMLRQSGCGGCGSDYGPAENSSLTSSRLQQEFSGYHNP